MVIILTHARIKDAQGKYDILFADLDIQQLSFVVVVVGANRLYSGSMDNTIKVSFCKLFAINV